MEPRELKLEFSNHFASKPSPSPHPPLSTSPKCAHIYLRQMILASDLPPLYIAHPTSPSPFSTSTPPPPISPLLTPSLRAIHSRFGPPKVRAPFLARDIELLQRELAGGMSRERREQVQVYVAGIRDPWARAMAEMYLARYPGFVMRGNGRLDFGTGEGVEGGRGGVMGGWNWEGAGCCAVM